MKKMPPTIAGFKIFVFIHISLILNMFYSMAILVHAGLDYAR